MQENRSFDHFFGAMPGVRGFFDPTAITLSTGKSVFYQPIPSSAGTGIAGGYNYYYSSTDEAVALHGSTLYFAHTGSDTISVIDAATLDPSNYNPTETDIHVGFDPEDLAVTPDGSQLWVADTGPQT